MATGFAICRIPAKSKVLQQFARGLEIVVPLEWLITPPLPGNSGPELFRVPFFDHPKDDLNPGVFDFPKREIRWV